MSLKAGYSAAQTRDDHGRWSAVGGAIGGAAKKYWNATHTGRHAEGAALAGAIAGVGNAGYGHGLVRSLRGDPAGLAVVAGSIAARGIGDRLYRKVDQTPLNHRIFNAAQGATTAGLVLGPHALHGARAGYRGAKHGMAFAKAERAGRAYRTQFNSPKIKIIDSNQYKFRELSLKAKNDVTRKPIIQIAMEMKKQMAAKRAGKKVSDVPPLRASFQLPIKRYKPVPPAPPAGPSTVMHVHNHFGPKPTKPMKKLAPAKKPMAKNPVKKKEAGMKCKDCGAPINASMSACPECGSKIVMKKEMAAQPFVFKEGDNYRWVLLSSNGYRDRDGELISTKALERDVALWDLEGAPLQPLRWWHVALKEDYSSGLEIGETDFRMVADHTLIESGTFIDPLVGEAVFKAQDQLAASVGFRHSPNQPNSDKIFDAVNIFERSLLPKGRQSNVLVELMVN